VHREVPLPGGDHDEVTCADCTPKPPARPSAGIRGGGAGRPESGWLFDDENTAVIDQPVGPAPDGIRRQEDDSPAGKNPPVRKLAVKKSSERKASGRTAPTTLKDDIQGPLIILTVLAAIVAVVGGLAGNSFLALAGGLLSGAALLAVIILGLTASS
jgi:hypothetical protein